MLSREIYSLGDPGTFDITDKDNPQYYVARLSHELSENLYNLQTDGFDFKQMENSDYTSFENAYDTYRALVVTWFTTAIGDSDAGDPITAVPALPDITSIVPWLGENPWLTFLVNLAIDLGLEWLRGKLASGTEASEVAQVLKQALIGENGASEEFPLLELLAAVPIEIILSKYGDFQDVVVSSQA